MVKRLETPPTFLDWEVKRAGAGLTITGRIRSGGLMADHKVTRVAAVRGGDRHLGQRVAVDDKGAVLAMLA